MHWASVYTAVLVEIGSDAFFYADGTEQRFGMENEIEFFMKHLNEPSGLCNPVPPDGPQEETQQQDRAWKDHRSFRMRAIG
jgi:hypothetical protein